MKKTILSLMGISVMLFFNNASAQKNGVCYTDEHNAALQQQNPSLIIQQQDVEDYIANFKSTYDPTSKKVTIIIPVVVHNVTHDGGQGYVSKATIEAQINKMTTDYKALNADLSSVRPLFQPYIAALDVEFRLARIDPNGNCTEGITRDESPYSYNTSVSTAENVKAVNYWNSKKYFNIWVIDAIQTNTDGSYVAGYAQFPTSGINSTYGVVCVNENFSGSDRTMTHEVGHCLNLFHTFQGNCGSSCGSSGDMCCDTPPTSNGGFDCNTASTCSNDATGSGSPYSTNVDDQFENYMSYSSCTHMFTLDQKTRMMATLNSTSTSTGLAQLSTPSNLTATGVADPYVSTPICIPLGADFTYNKQYLCEGESVTYADLNTYNATPTLWNWSFTGGTPNSSNVASPVITYNTVGTYSATYSPGTTAGFATPITKTNIITVSTILANFMMPYVEGMENTTSFNNDWTIQTQSGNGWQNSTVAAATGTRSLRVNNLGNSANDVTEAVSSSIDLTTMTSPQLTFKTAYAKKVTGSSNDQLIVYSSIDCGASWQIRTVKTASYLSTLSTPTDLAYTPTAGQWKETIVSLSTLATQANVRFKFYFKNNGGNNIYLDDININGTVGLKETPTVNSFRVYPNPMNESAVISYNIVNVVKNLKISLRDVLGKEVITIVNGQHFSSGKYTLNIDKEQKLKAGLYFIEFNADNNIITEKLIVK